MPPVSSKRHLLRLVSETPSRLAIPSRCQTCSNATFDVFTSIPAFFAMFSTASFAAGSSLSPACFSSSVAIVAASLGLTMRPSTCSLPSLAASSSSAILRCARVMEMDGRTSSPAAISFLKTTCARWPHGSRVTILSGSNHDGFGLTSNTGSVSV